MLSVDIEQIKKYNVPGPRYTSNPPAVHFKPGLNEEFVIDRLRTNSLAERDLSLYFHLPFCQTLCWYCGCTTVITTQQGQSATYLDYLKKEMDLMAELLN